MANNQGREKSLEDTKQKEKVDFYLQGHRRETVGTWDLPAELIYMVADYLDNQTLCRFAAVSKRHWEMFRSICHEKALNGEGLVEEKMAALDRGDLIEVPMPLFNKAVGNGNLCAVRSFLDHRVNPNSSYRDFPGSTASVSALYQAVDLCNAIDMADLLLSYGANPSLENLWTEELRLYRPLKLLRSPLLQAARNGNSELVCLLLKYGARIEPRYGFHEFIMNCNETVVSHIIDNGFDPFDPSNSGREYFHHAAANRNGRGVLDLMASLSLDRLDRLDEEINRCDGNGWTPLIAAIEIDREDNVQALLQYGADPNMLDQNFYRSTRHPLTRACIYNLETAVSALIRAGANINFREQHRVHVLHYAVKVSASMTEIILEAGADVRSVTRYGNTPLHIACMSEDSNEHFMSEDNDEYLPHVRRDVDLKIVELLLAWGAPVNAKNKAGLTPIDVAGDHSVVAAMKKSQSVG
jgi:ankyrin repeat protein